MPFRGKTKWYESKNGYGLRDKEWEGITAGGIEIGQRILKNSYKG